MLTLIQYPAAFGSSSASPFCVKTEVLLKMANLEYVTEDMVDARKMPHQKLPVLRDGERLIHDSVCIRRYLEGKPGVIFDAHLSSEQKAQSYALVRMCEDSLYWKLLYSRWMDDTTWEVIKQHFFGDIPWPGKVIVPALVRKQVRRDLHGQGLGRHSREQVFQFGTNDIQALADWLGDKSFFFGDKPSTADATVYAFLAAFYFAPFASPLKEAVTNLGTLASYCERLQKEFEFC